MKGEINRDWYCSFVGDGPLWCQVGITKYCAGCCLNAHRKHPTPEQFKEEYGEEYPGDCPVFARFTPAYMLGEHHDWDLEPYFEAKEIKEIYEDSFEVVCACTPWGKPPNDWRPE